MKLKILLPITLVILALVACNGGGEGSASANPGNTDNPLPPELQTYSYVANFNSSISVCKMTLNGFYRSPCASYTDNVLPNAYSIVVNQSNKQVFVAGNNSISSLPGYWQNCSINTNGGLNCQPKTQFANINWPSSMATYYPNVTAAAGGAVAFVTDANSNTGQIYVCNITTLNDTLDGNTCREIFATNRPAQFGLAVQYGNPSYLYVSNAISSSYSSSVYRYTINSTTYALSDPQKISDTKSQLLSSAGKMVVNPIANYLYVSNITSNSIAEYGTPNGANPTSTSTVFNENDGIAINSLYGSTDPRIPATNSFIYVTNRGSSVGATPYISKCPINSNGTLGFCEKLGSGFYKPYAIAISGPVNP